MTESLSHVTGYVSDAYRPVPLAHFDPENTLLGSYTFLSWVRSGISAVIKAPVGSLRGHVEVSLPVQAEGKDPLVVVRPVEVRGPGDVLGIDERQVIRRYPVPGTTNAEDSYLAHVEFNRPELPWLMSPAPPHGAALLPWLALVVLKDGRWSLDPGEGGLPPVVHTFLGELQSLDDADRWAHAQVIGPEHTGPSMLDRLSRAQAPANLSRLLCPRRLESDQGYLACVVPVFNAGLQVGRDLPLPATLDLAWHRQAGDDSTSIALPVYSSWRFRVSADGDFGTLASKLRGVPAPWQVGRRLLDTAAPGGGLPPLATGGLQTIHGPLVSPNGPQAASADPKEAAAAASGPWPAPQAELLRAELNRPAVLAQQPASSDAIPRPVVGPELYARFHAAVSRLAPDRDADWLGQLNLQVEHRVQAGLGTRVVQRDQEPLMQSAWAQVGQIDVVNRQLRFAQLARFVGTSWHTRHLTPLGLGDLLSTTRGVASRVRSDTPVTVAADIADSHLAPAATAACFRRLTRPLGGLNRFVSQPADRAAHARLVASGGVARDLQLPYVEVDGIDAVSARTATAFAGGALDLPGLSLALAARPPMPDLFTPAVAAAPINTAIPLVQSSATQLLARVSAAPVAVAVAPVPVVPVAPVVHVSHFAVLQHLLSKFLPHLFGAQQIPAPQQVAAVANQDAVLRLVSVAKEPNWANVAAGFAEIAQALVDVRWPTTPVRPAPAPGNLLQKINPAVTLTSRVRARLGDLPYWLPPDWFDDQLVAPILAAPVFTRPMYEALDAYSREWLLPGLATFGQPDIVTVLTSNGPFVESFLAGLSHEMGRELLSRGYPTDQRGTYFRRFWTSTHDDLAQDLHRFTPTPLGTHLDTKLDNRVVLMVRGELLRRYPDAIVLAMLASDQDADGVPIFEAGQVAPILFHGHLDPDIVLVGFNLTTDAIRAAAVAPGDGTTPGWWFVVAEHPTAPRFGVPTGAPIDAALTAHTLLRDPVRAVFEGVSMLTQIGAP